MNLYAELRKFIEPSVPELIKDLLKALETCPAEFVRDNIIDGLMAAILAFLPTNTVIWANSIQSLNEDILTIAEKKSFMK